MTVTTVSDRIALAAVPSPTAKVAFLSEDGREGLFQFQTGNYASEVASDTLQGLHVESGSVSTSAGCWVRVWDGINGQPEWFGAVPNNLAAASGNLAALNACVALCPVVILDAADYYISGTWVIDTEYRTIKSPVIADGYNTGHGARVISTDTSADCIQVGPSTRPANLNSYYRNIKVAGVCARWASALTASQMAGNEADEIKAWRIQYLLNGRFEDCAAWEPFIGFYHHGNVATYFERCRVFRSTVRPGPGSEVDFLRGFWPRGNPAVISGSGGNPSLYYKDCKVGTGGGISLDESTGLYIESNFSDIFVDRLETASCDRGIIIDGALTTEASGNLNMHVRDCVLDQCRETCLEISAINDRGMVTVSGGYFQLVGDGVTHRNAIHIHATKGAVSVGGGAQVLGGPSSTVNRGIYISGQDNVTIDHTVKIKDFPWPVAIDGGSDGVCVFATIDNPNVGTGNTAAVSLNGTNTRFHIAPTVSGKANAFQQGIFVIGSSNDQGVLDPTRIDRTALAGNITVISSSPINIPGYYTSAGAGTSLGNGIHVTGITN